MTYGERHTHRYNLWTQLELGCVSLAEYVFGTTILAVLTPEISAHLSYS